MGLRLAAGSELAGAAFARLDVVAQKDVRNGLRAVPLVRALVLPSWVGTPGLRSEPCAILLVMAGSDVDMVYDVVSQPIFFFACVICQSDNGRRD